MKRPEPEEYSAFYQKYIDTVGDDVFSELAEQLVSIPTILKSIPSEMANYSYAKDKWTIKELLGHMIDTERIMAYRLLRFARNDRTELAGFEENDYVQNAYFSGIDFDLMIEEFEAVRRSNLYLFNSLKDEDLFRSGLANKALLSVRALLFIIAGHANHHMSILKERYL